MIFRTSVFSILTSVFSAVITIAIGPSFATAQQSPSATEAPAVLVDSNWLTERIDEVRLIDLGQTEDAFNRGHIKNAVYVDWKTQITNPTTSNLFNLPPRDSLETLLSQLGVTPEMSIVLADNRSNRISTRFYWTLKIYGHADVRILNGGTFAWRKAGKKLSTEKHPPQPTQYKFPNGNEKYAADNFADTQSVIDSIKQGDVLIDGRPTPQYTGAEPGIVFHTNLSHQRRGHIESAINVPWRENFTEQGKFKSVNELGELYENAGVTRDKKIVTYCNEGLHAAPTWFVLKELLGYPNVKLYDDSMGVWANRTNTPMTQTEAIKK